MKPKIKEYLFFRKEILICEGFYSIPSVLFFFLSPDSFLFCRDPKHYNLVFRFWFLIMCSGAQWPSYF